MDVVRLPTRYLIRPLAPVRTLSKKKFSLVRSASTIVALSSDLSDLRLHRAACTTASARRGCLRCPLNR